MTEGTETDDPSVFGEEAHIIGKAKNGPRAKRIADIDTYSNLILLCRKHHKQIDDQVEHFTVERLRDIKERHEKWIASLGNPENPDPVRIIPDPTRPVSKVLRLFLTGTSFWNFVDGSNAFYPSWPDGLSEEQNDLVADFFDDLRDWIDVSSDLDTFRARRDAAKALSEHMKALGRAGLFVGARERFLLVTGGISAEPSTWRAVDVEIQPMGLAQIVDANGNPIQLDQLFSSDS